SSQFGREMAGMGGISEAPAEGYSPARPACQRERWHGVGFRLGRGAQPRSPGRAFSPESGLPFSPSRSLLVLSWSILDCFVKNSQSIDIFPSFIGITKRAFTAADQSAMEGRSGSGPAHQVFPFAAKVLRPLAGMGPASGFS